MHGGPASRLRVDNVLEARLHRSVLEGVKWWRRGFCRLGKRIPGLGPTPTPLYGSLELRVACRVLTKSS